jgi:hypothetical protein
MPLTIGNPPKSYPLQVDIASSDIFLSSKGCSSSSCPQVDKSYISDNFYDESISRSFTPIADNSSAFNLTFSDGSFLSGYMARERMSLDVSSTGRMDEIVLPDQVFGVVNGTNIDMDAEGIVGIMGLGFPRLSQLARIGLGGGQVVQPIVSSSTSTSATTSTSSQSSAASATTSTTGGTTATTTSSTEATSSGANIFFSILPIGTISSAPSTQTGSLSKRAESVPEYYPPFLESLFNLDSNNRSNGTELPSYPVFGLALSNSSQPYSEKTSGSSITFGGVAGEYVLPINETTTGSGRTVDDIEWHDVVPYGQVNGLNTSRAGDNFSRVDLELEQYLYWTLELGQVTMNGTQVALAATYNSSLTGLSGSTALLDVGTNGIFAPQQDVVELFSHVQDSRQVADGRWAVPCDTRQTMTFAFGADGGRVIELQPSEWMYARVSGSSMCLAWPVVSPPNSDADWQLGTPFLRKVYTVFGYGISGVQSPVVGFLPLPNGERLGSAARNSTNGTVTTSAATKAPTDPTPTTVQTLSEVESLLTAVIPTVLPNVLLPNPSYTTAGYNFNASAGIPAVGALQTVGLANASHYSVGQVPIVSSVMPTGSRTVSSTPAQQTQHDGARNSGQSAIPYNNVCLIVALLSSIIALLTSHL